MKKMFVSAGELLYNINMSEFLIQNSDIILKLVVAVVLGTFIGA